MSSLQNDKCAAQKSLNLMTAMEQDTLGYLPVINAHKLANF